MRTEYRRDLQHSYLVLSPGEKQEEAYPLRMITENQIQGLLSCSCRRMNEEILYYYDITSRISLAERCLCRKITGKELIVLIQSLIRVLTVMDEYLLNGNSLCLKPEYIYMDVQMNTVDFCYVPGELWDLEENFRELLEGILPLLDHQNQEDVLVGYGLYHYAVQESFSVEGLQRLLEQYRRDGDHSEKDESSEDEPQPEEPEERRYDMAPEKYEAALDAFFEDEQEETRSHPAAVTLSTVGIILYGMTGWYLWRNFRGYLWAWGGGIALIFGIAVLFIWKRKKDREEILPESESVETQKKETIEPNRAKQPELIIKEGKRMEEACNTQILRPGCGTGTYILEERYPNAGHQVKLNENSIQFIGHLESMADVILPSNAVSRLHARFRRDKDGCYLRDLNSRNGTWVNGQELQGEQEVEIKPGDEIRFADMIYNLRQI